MNNQLFNKNKKDSDESLEKNDSQKIIEPKDEISLENLSLEGIENKKSSNKDVDNYVIRNTMNKRREHLSAKEDQLLRKKETAKAKANRKLMNGLISVVLILLFLSGLYTAFPTTINNYVEKTKESILFTWGGVFNRDIQNTMKNDVRKVIGGTQTGIFIKDLNTTTLNEIKNSGIKFVTQIPESIGEQNKDEKVTTIEKGNYLIGAGLVSGIYYGDGTTITIYNSVDDMKDNKNGTKITLNKQFVTLNIGQLVNISEYKEFVLASDRKTTIIKKNKIKNDTEYQVGKDIDSGTYTIKPTKEEGVLTITSEYGVVTNKTITEKTEVNLDTNSIVKFSNLKIITE